MDDLIIPEYPDAKKTIDNDGFLLLGRVLSQLQIQSILDQWQSLISDSHATILKRGDTQQSSIYGARNLLTSWPNLIEVVNPIKPLLKEFLGENAGLVRGLFFDKPPVQDSPSWALPMHRDYTIAVKSHVPNARFQKPTIKSGVPHYEAPIELLSRMLTIRIHLDPMTPENGALKVIRGSHLHEDNLSDNPEPILILGEAGDILLMKPLILHGSACSTSKFLHRRILHLEFTADLKPDENLEWWAFEKL
jgi:ectoine hydroxylase-related dioxygenase (phytanoyl-CoA dioxygenase family)